MIQNVSGLHLAHPPLTWTWDVHDDDDTFIRTCPSTVEEPLARRLVYVYNRIDAGTHVVLTCRLIRRVSGDRFAVDYNSCLFTRTSHTCMRAQVTADASAACESKVTGGGKAKGCAYATTFSFAFQVAYAQAHAQASAEAFARHCSCNDAEAWAFGEADFFIALLADAFAEAEATVCSAGAYTSGPKRRSQNDPAVSGQKVLNPVLGSVVDACKERQWARAGNEKSLAQAHVDCFANIVAETYALAAARASVEAGCFRGRRKAGARARFKATVDGLTRNNEGCIVREKESGAARATGTGESSTHVVRRLPCRVHACGTPCRVHACGTAPVMPCPCTCGLPEQGLGGARVCTSARTAVTVGVTEASQTHPGWVSPSSWDRATQDLSPRPPLV